MVHSQIDKRLKYRSSLKCVGEVCLAPGSVSVNAEALSAPITCRVARSHPVRAVIPHGLVRPSRKLCNDLEEFDQVTYDQLEAWRDPNCSLYAALAISFLLYNRQGVCCACAI
jgi:hypothetical protein